MKLAENQKIFKQLNIDDTLWNDIKKMTRLIGIL